MIASLIRLCCLPAAAVVLAACLDVPEGLPPMCHTSDDCNRSRGQVCEEGVCWGDPPPGAYAAVVSPPSSRPDLMSRELPQLVIPDFGWMGDLALETPVLLSGKLVAFCPPPMVCDPTPLAGTVTVTRSSQFHGGPGFRAVSNVAAGAAFAIPVRRTKEGDDEYTVTILPDSVLPASGPSAAQLVPPRRLHVAVADSAPAQDIELGGPDLPTISGRLVDSAGRGLGSYRVVALGHWDPTEPAIEVSTFDVTDATGAYAITLSDELVDSVELVARPIAARSGDPAPVAATIRVANVDANVSSVRNVALPADLGGPTLLVLKIQGQDPGGSTIDVAGAQVSVTGASTPTGSLTTFTRSDVAVSDRNGQVALRLLDGAALAGAYRVSVTPPAGSSFAVMFDQKVALGSPPPLRLASRIKLHGFLVDGDDKPVPSTAVTVRPSLRFLWALDPAVQPFVAAIPAATDVTKDTGEFVLSVDPNIADIWGSYDVLFEPPTGSRTPSFLKEVMIDRFTMPLDADLEMYRVPGPAFVHGRITGPDGKSVDGAELKVYLVSTLLTLCTQVQHAPASCPIPAELQARSTSDDEGTVRLVMPRCEPSRCGR